MKTLYEIDFAAWLEQQTALLKKKDFQKLDLDHLIEEIQDLGASDKRAIMSYLIVIMTHMIKQKYQPEKNGRTWQDSIDVARAQIKLYMDEIPSLRKFPAQVYLSLYPKAAKVAMKAMQNDIPIDACPWSIQEILGESLW